VRKDLKWHFIKTGWKKFSVKEAGSSRVCIFGISYLKTESFDIKHDDRFGALFIPGNSGFPPETCFNRRNKSGIP
jgi:hypothetical protein